MERAKSLMLQGTASDVGKSLLCTALCRIFKEDGFRVAPFKAQNMALNSYVTPDGGEIGRAQGVQAEAAGVAPVVEMNPILLKPKEDLVAQVIVRGKSLGDLSAKAYRSSYLTQAGDLVKECLDSLSKEYEILVIEGAGSPAEVNLKDQDIVNMATARWANAPVILVADIDRGGVFASLLGTLELLDDEERELVAGFIINKFRGDLDLLRPGLDFLEEKTGKPVLGVIPFLWEHGIDQEDSLALSHEDSCYSLKGAKIEIAIIQLPHMLNFTDLNALRYLPETMVRYVRPGEKIGKPDAVIIPGTQNVIQGLLELQDRGYAQEIKELAATGKFVVGLSGGYQMLGQKLYDHRDTVSEPGFLPGLGLLDLVTTLGMQKNTHQVKAEVVCDRGFWKQLQRETLQGYEIDCGQTELGGHARPLLEIRERSGKRCSFLEGAVSEDGQVCGTHLHGLFDNRRVLLCWINALREQKKLPPLQEEQLSGYDREASYDKLAATVRRNLDINQLYRIMGIGEA